MEVTMGNYRVHAVGAFWTVAMAVPAALLALAIFAFFDRYLAEIASAVAAAFTADWQAFANDASRKRQNLLD